MLINCDWLTSGVAISVFMLITDRIVSPWAHRDAIYHRTPAGKRFIKCVEYLHEFHDRIINERKQEFKKILDANENNKQTSENVDMFGKERKYMAFMDTLLREHFKDPNALTMEDIRGEVNVFVVAGHDITSISVMWTVYMLSIYPEHQQKVHEELDEIFGDDRTRPMTVEDSRKMQYLERCFKESTRIYPPAPILARDVPKRK